MLLKLNSKGEMVSMLQEMLNAQGAGLPVTGFFGKQTEAAVMNFQKKNGLVADGVVGPKSWTKLMSNPPAEVAASTSKFLTEKDLQQVAAQLGIEVPVIKAVNTVESSGKGFYLNGDVKILFERHWFWKLLKQKGIDPNTLAAGNTDIVNASPYSKYPSTDQQHGILDRAAALSPDKRVAEAANEACSWGAFQIMGFHAKPLGYKDVFEFVKLMQKNEGEHLKAFARFIEVNNLVQYLQKKNWAGFASRYNGPNYQRFQYDTKLANAYNKYAALV